LIKKLVTVVITTRNRASLIERAIKSVLYQTYKPIELIVVDDFSSDNTEVILRKFKNKIIFIRHKECKGGAAARMTGSQKAKGNYIAFLDDDDEWHSSKIEKQYIIAESTSSNCAVITCGAKITNNRSTAYLYPVLNGRIRPKIFSTGFITIPSNHFFKKEIFDNIGGYDLDLPAHNEHDIWMKLAKADYETKLIKEPLVIVREDGRERMMTDTTIRIKSFEIFYRKWKNYVYQWYGFNQGKKILNKYMTSIYLMNASLLEERNKREEARLFSIKVIKYLVPFEFNTYTIKMFLRIMYYCLPLWVTNMNKIIKSSIKYKFNHQYI